jgi:HK97 family phage portal protein
MTVFSAVRTALTTKRIGTFSPVGTRGGWNPFIHEPYAGAWQQNAEESIDLQLAFSAVYACVTLISNDFGKMRQKLVERVGGIGKVWSETSSSAFSPFLRKPNRYQNHIQFKQWWTTSKLEHGNTYALKERDSRGIVIAEYILDPTKVLPLVTPDGSVYYQLGVDNLAGLQDSGVVVPASEIVHDRMNCLFHPLVGVSPLYAAGLAAAQGLSIQRQSRTFFGNGARPSGVLTAPAAISQATADRLKANWEEKFNGTNSGKIAVLGDGLKYEPMTMTAVDAQVIQQLGWTIENVCMAFHVPPWKIGHGQMPTYSNGELLNQQYYDECLQSLIEEYELVQDNALGIGEGVMVEGRELGIELDLRALLRMDTVSRDQNLRENVRGSVITINDARLEMDLPPVEGGDTIWMQQQNYSVEALIARDEAGPFAKPEPAPALPAPDEGDDEEPDVELALALLYMKSPESLSNA